MNSYFQTLIDRLTIDEIELLNILSKNQSFNHFSAKVKKDLMSEVNTSEAKFRKMICRLEALNFISIVSGSREHLLFITEYGQQAIHFICERSNL